MKIVNEDIVKNKIYQLIYNENVPPRTKYLMIENLIKITFSDYLSKQSKELAESKKSYGFDLFVENGFDDFEGNTAIDIKWLMNSFGPSLRFVYDTIGRVSLNDFTINNLLFIIIGELSENDKAKLCKNSQNGNFKIHVWSIDELTYIFSSNIDLFNETYDNINKILLNSTINKGFSRTAHEYIEKRNKYITQLKKAYNNDDVVLFLGSGISRDAGIPTWDSLISDLFVSLVDQKLKENGIDLNEEEKSELVDELKSQNNNSPLLQTRFIKQGVDEFDNIVKAALYKNAKNSSRTLEAISQICIPKRGKTGIKAIINYNFDDLIEKNLSKDNLEYKSIYNEGITPSNEELGIFHVHGFLPEEETGYKDLSDSLWVFSEESYHKLMLDPYHWSNITQLNYLMNNTCLFIGLSMTDPNLRRLLDIATKKNVDDNCKHYVIMKRFKINNGNKNIKQFSQINEELQESFYHELGVNVIWVNDYSEIPNLLKQIKN